MLTLRPYQERALAELYDWLDRHPQGNPIVNMCVAAGKSIVIAELCRRAIEQYPQTRIVMCVASRELCDQNLKELLNIWPEAPAGVCSASLGRRDLESQIIFATIGSIANHAKDLGRCDMLLVDECHNINPANKGQYRKFIAALQRYGNSHLCVIGFTGTPFRGNGVWLHHGDDPLFHGIATNITMTELLESGHLTPLVIDRETPQLGDVSTVKVAAGDYVVSDLETIMADDQLIAQTVQDLIQRGQNRSKWLLFCVSVKHAQKTLNTLKHHGIDADMITGETPARERDQIITDFKQGSLRALVNVACLTTGFNAPATDLIALLRPTKSPVLYVQIAGRGMRLSPHKHDCLWLDYTPTTSELGAVNLIKGRKKTTNRQGAGGGAPQKECDHCGNPAPISALECADCGFIFPVSQAHSNRPIDALPLHGIQAPEIIWFKVKSIRYDKHFSRDAQKPPTLKVTYYCGLESLVEWKALQGEGFAFRMAANWWAQRWQEGTHTPTTIDEALELTDHLRAPTRIGAIRNGQYWEIRNYEFDPVEAGA